MADAIATAKVVPSGSAQVIGDIVTALLAESLDAVVADPGNDLVVSADITHSEAADADGTTSAAAIDAAITAVGDCELVGPIKIEADPVLTAPGDVALDISDGDTENIEWTVTLSQDASLVSAVLTSSELDGVNVPYSIFHGDPQGHDSQKSSAGIIRAVVGPAPSGADVGSPHDLTLTVTDSDGRTKTDVVAVTVTA